MFIIALTQLIWKTIYNYSEKPTLFSLKYYVAY